MTDRVDVCRALLPAGVPAGVATRIMHMPVGARHAFQIAGVAF